MTTARIAQFSGETLLQKPDAKKIQIAQFSGETLHQRNVTPKIQIAALFGEALCKIKTNNSNYLLNLN